MLQHRGYGCPILVAGGAGGRILLVAHSGDVTRCGGAPVPTISRLDNNTQVAASSVGVVHVHTRARGVVLVACCLLLVAGAGWCGREWRRCECEVEQVERVPMLVQVLVVLRSDGSSIQRQQRPQRPQRPGSPASRAQLAALSGRQQAFAWLRAKLERS
jgi:hypothetical protein